MNHSDRFDIIVVGAGVAGVSIALSLAVRQPHLKVALLEQF